MDGRHAIVIANDGARRTGALDYSARRAAATKYRERRPDVSERDAELEVRKLIDDASVHPMPA